MGAQPARVGGGPSAVGHAVVGQCGRRGTRPTQDGRGRGAARRGEFVRYDVTLPSLDGPAHTFDFSLTPVADNSGQIVLLVAEGRDITEQRRLEAVLREANQQLLLAQEQANRLAITDFLTALYNRRGFFILAEQQKRLALRTHARGLLIFIDMDDLKRANDQYGHEAGDALIVGAATVLTRAFCASDLVARLGGDEFAVLTSLSAGDSAAAFTNRLVSHIDTFNGEGGLPMPLRMSIGMHEFEWTPDLSLDALPARADAAMYEQKRSNKEKLPADSRG
jgi:diguanylate cyclase (GGDEF)-like protein